MQVNGSALRPGLSPDRPDPVQVARLQHRGIVAELARLLFAASQKTTSDGPSGKSLGIGIETSIISRSPLWLNGGIGFSRRECSCAGKRELSPFSRSSVCSD